MGTTFLLTHFFSQQHSVMSLQNASEEAITEWVKAFHRASDSTDLGQFYTKNGSLKFANNDLLDGLDAITAFFDTIGNKIYQTCTITYIIKDDPQGRTIKIPAMSVFHLVPGADFKSGKALIEHFNVYLDGSEVFSIVGEVQKLKSEGKL